ncbi:hypothetical protein [Gordonia sp. SMJS1]|uniref:hypothetical protein n=1 Tax=Gordonia sp. SMJS1 TaxID=3039400 RepID=UPI0024557D11|nr:hypothetical protein [Gordonia sp. SMJS1]WGJ88023.1 hypothetical protein QAD21_24225 [Gordonia sp. SMJS1]
MWLQLHPWFDGVDYELVESARRGKDGLRPSAEIAGWVFSCDCASRSRSEVSTWTDPVQWTRVPSASLEDLARHRVFTPDTDVHADERPEVADAARAVWQHDHLDPDRRRRRDPSRRGGPQERRLGRSWADIGAAAGMTRQSANERWKDRVCGEDLCCL